MDASVHAHINDRLRQERIRRNWHQRDVAEHLGTTVVTVNRWERGIQQPGAYFRIKLCALFGKSAQELGFLPDDQSSHTIQVCEESSLAGLPVASSASPLRWWGIPYPRNPFFTGRENILHHLHELLSQQRTMTLTQSWTLSGLGGIGKTQTALEYAYRHCQDYKAVLWVSAETVESLLASFIAIAELLKLPEKNHHEQLRIVDAVIRWLTDRDGWLLIFDNVEEPELLKRFLPPARRGCLLFTSRRQGLGLTSHTLKLDQMTPEEGMRFLLYRAGWLDPTASFDQLAPTDQALAKEIVAAMGGLPLALDQVGAYLEATQCSLADYLHLFHLSQLRLLDEYDASTDHPLSVTKTFALVFEHLERSNLLAVEVLTVCAFLSPEAIPEAFFLQGAAYLGATLEKLVADSFAFHAALKALLTYSLIQRDATTHTLTIHRLVQVVLKGRLSKTAWRTWAKRVIEAMTALFPSDEEMQADYWQACERLLPHALVCVTLAEQCGESEVLNITLLSHIAGYLSKRARYAEAQPLLDRARALGEQALSPEHPLVAEVLYRQAELSRFQGNYAEAESLFQRSLHIWEHTLGSEHLLATEALNNLGVVFYEQGKYAQAEPLLERALQIWEQALGSHHPKIARPLNNLGLLYWRQGRYEQAQPVLQRALCIRELALGPQHFQVATSLNNLAYLYTAQGKYEQAEPLFERALHIWEQALGSEHLQVVYPLHGLATIYTEQGKYEQAKSFYQRALAIGEQALGSQHPAVAEALTHLGTLYQKQGQYQEAEPLYRRALRIWEQQLGSIHPLVARALTELATLHSEQSQYAQAEPLFARALQIWEQMGGAELLQTAQGGHRQTGFSSERQPDEPAASLCEHALALRKRAQSPLHPEVAETVRRLAYHYQRQQQITEALSLYQHALTLHEQLLGACHPKTVKTREELLDLLAQVEHVKESTTLHDQMPERASRCACGCGRQIDMSKSRGEPRRFFSTACKQRFYRNASRRKRNAGPGPTTCEEITP